MPKEKKKKDGGGRQITLTLSDNDFELLERMVKEGGHFKSVEDYLLMMIENRLIKFRRE